MNQARFLYLCQLAQIDPVYIDAFGNKHEVSIETQQKLIKSLGFLAESEQEVEISISFLEAQNWRTKIPKTLILKEKYPINIPLVLSNGSEEYIKWWLTEENGSKHEGNVFVSCLPVKD